MSMLALSVKLLRSKSTSTSSPSLTSHASQYEKLGINGDVTGHEMQEVNSHRTSTCWTMKPSHDAFLLSWKTHAIYAPFLSHSFGRYESTDDTVIFPLGSALVSGLFFEYRNRFMSPKKARSQNLWVKSIRKSGVVSWECAGRAALSLSHSAQSRSQRRATASEAHCRRFGLEP